MQTVFKVEGMSCSHCENSIKTALGQLTGVLEVLVDLDGKSVKITHDDSMSIDLLKETIEDQGYDVV